MLMGSPDRYGKEGQPSSGADFGSADPGTSDVLPEISTVVELSVEVTEENRDIFFEIASK